MPQKTIIDSANEYIPKSVKNIAELKSVSVDLVLESETGTDSEGKEFKYNYATIDGEKYRIPDAVLRDLKAILQRKPTLKNFAVNKTGEGRNTKYTIIPLD
jgi:hypothetical protein